MSQTEPGSQDARGGLAAAIEALRRDLPLEEGTRLIDLAATDDRALEQLFQIAEGRVAVVVLRVRYDAIYRGDGPPPRPPDLLTEVLARVGELVRASIRASDLVVRSGPDEVAVVLPQSGPLEARAQAARLRGPTAEQRFTYRGFEVRWTARLGLATYHGAAALLGPRKVLENLFASAD